MDIDIDLLEKMPLRDVVYLCLRDERPEQYNGNANLPSSGAFVDESNITRDQCCGNYGLEHVRSGLRLCNKVDQSNSLEWTVFNRNNSFVAVTVWYPEYCDDESDGHIEFMSEELDRAGMEKFVMEQLRIKAEELAKALEEVNHCIDAGGRALLNGFSASAV